MDFEWYEEKRLRTLEGRQLDFLLADLFFDGRPVVHRNGEERTMSTAFVNGSFLTLVWTQRSENVRVISLRRSRVSEERTYRSIYN